MKFLTLNTHSWMEKEAEEKKVHIAIFSISKIVYLVIHNTTNEITFDIRKIYLQV